MWRPKDHHERPMNQDRSSISRLDFAGRTHRMLYTRYIATPDSNLHSYARVRCDISRSNNTWKDHVLLRVTRRVARADRQLPFSVFLFSSRNYFFAFGHSKIGGGGGVGSLGLPNHTDLLKRPFITGGCHLLLHTTVAVGFSAVTVAMLTVLKR